MTKKSRKYRKTPTRALGDSPSNVVCRRGDYQSKHARTMTIRGCSAKRKQNERMKKEDKKQRRRSEQEKGSTSLTKKKPSVSFFIPYRDVPTEEVIGFSNLLFCQSNNEPAEFSYFPCEKALTMYYCKPTVSSELRLKGRTESESSNNSEDSFICFEDDDTHDDSFICFTDDDSDDDSDDDDPDDHQVKLNSSVSDENNPSECEDQSSSSSEETSKKKKRVSFVDNSRLVTIRWIVAWDYAYRAARVSQWMTMARDAKRFKQRIQSLEPILSPVFSAEHRARIWETRMSTAG